MIHLGVLVLPLVTIFGSPSELPETRLSSAECETTMYWSDKRQEWSAAPQTMLPCTPAACAPAFCEEGVRRSDGSLLCLDSDEVFPAGHWTVDDWQEDDEPGDSVHYTVEY